MRLWRYLPLRCRPVVPADAVLSKAALLKQADDFALQAYFALVAGTGARDGPDARLMLQSLHCLRAPRKTKVNTPDAVLWKRKTSRK